MVSVFFCRGRVVQKFEGDWRKIVSNEKQFVTSDLSLAAALGTLSGIDPSLEIGDSGMVVFALPPDIAQESLRRFYCGAEVSAFQLIEQLKTLRAGMNAKRRGGRS